MPKTTNRRSNTNTAPHTFKTTLTRLPRDRQSTELTGPWCFWWCFVVFCGGLSVAMCVAGTVTSDGSAGGSAGWT